MNVKNASSQNSLLREMVKVKKLRFQDQETWKDGVQVTRDFWQRSENFREFKAIYEETVHTKLSENQPEVHETKSGSFCRVPRIKPQYIKTVNIELPVSILIYKQHKNYSFYHTSAIKSATFAISH